MCPIKHRKLVSGRVILLAVLALFLVACTQKKQIIAGTSLDLAIERKNVISQLKYDLTFDIPASKSESIRGTVLLQFDLKNSSPILQLDFSGPAANIKTVRANNKDIQWEYENEHLLIDQGSLNEGSNFIYIEFIAGETALNRNEEYLYTLFVPARASTCFPVFDQPDLKAEYNLQLSIPRHWLAMSNGKTMSIDSAGDKKRYRFGSTRPTSTYQFAFAAGKFQKATDHKSGMTMFFRETDSAKVAHNLPRIFELHRQSLAWMKDYTGLDYPYEKFDFALIPAFQFGGMEHPGNIFYRESSLFLDPSAAVNEELRRTGLIAHETAHMWFGNLVTMKWFNDVWLKEVFANFMAAKITEPRFPQINHKLRFLMAHYPSAYDIDRSLGTHPIQQPLDNLKNAGSVYGAIIYQKAPIMMRNLESWMGEANFQQGVKEYLTSYSYQNATWDDLVGVLKKHTSNDLDVWNKAWIKSKGMPEISYSIVPDERKYKLQINTLNDSIGIAWPQLFVFGVGAEGNEKVETKAVTILKGQRAEVSITDTVDVRFIPNYQGKGYGYFHADLASLNHLRHSINLFDNAEARAGVWMMLWEFVLRGELDPSTMIQHLMEALQKEKDPLLLEYLADKTGRIFWQFLTPAQRNLVSKPLDDLLFELMALEQDHSRKRTLFNCYRNVALSTEGVLNLSRFWKNEITLGLELSERDHIQLAWELAVREVEGHESILADQLKAITNPDRKSELLFIQPALSSNVVVRDAFFESLKKKENRVHEPWVLEALRYLHHPLRCNYSIKYIPSSLALLEEMQRTGDIFFPKGWLDATLGEYQSEEAASFVRAYLEKNVWLRADLKNKLLQSADMLFRAEQAMKKNQMAASK